LSYDEFNTIQKAHALGNGSMIKQPGVEAAASWQPEWPGTKPPLAGCELDARTTSLSATMERRGTAGVPRRKRRHRPGTRLRLLRGGDRSTIGGSADDPGRGAAYRGQHRQAAEHAAPAAVTSFGNKSQRKDVTWVGRCRVAPPALTSRRRPEPPVYVQGLAFWMASGHRFVGADN